MHAEARGFYVFARSWLTTGVPRAVFRSLDWPRCCHVAETSGTVKRATDRVFEHCKHLPAQRRPLFGGQSDVRVAGHASDIRRPSESTVPTVLHPCKLGSLEQTNAVKTRTGAERCIPYYTLESNQPHMNRHTQKHTVRNPLKTYGGSTVSMSHFYG